jgi:uncharacterized protein YxeA
LIIKETYNENGKEKRRTGNWGDNLRKKRFLEVGGFP